MEGAPNKGVEEVGTELEIGARVEDPNRGLDVAFDGAPKRDDDGADIDEGIEELKMGMDAMEDAVLVELPLKNKCYSMSIEEKTNNKL